MFDGFAHKRIQTSATEIALVQGGNGSPLLLVHGYPQNHVMWHKVAPRLAQRFTVVAPDLRGYGASGKPPTDSRHLPYSKRAMALDLVEVMTALGFDRFDIVGHDRGARVTYRLALDHPDRVRHAAVLDVVPTIEQFERMDRNGARAAYHWFFLAQPAPFPETLIGKDPDYFIEHSMQAWCGTPGAFTPEAMAAYREAFRDPAVIHGTCEDYRAGIGCDCAFDDADRKAGKKIAAPLLALFGARGRPFRGDRLLDTWKSWALDVRCEPLECGHFIAEEAPDALLDKLLAFL
jgi:haloacetate dehalogenase